MHLPQIGSRQVLYQDRYQQIYRVTADFGSFTKEYFVRDSGQRAGVVVVQDKCVLLVRQYRLLINSLSWEIPGGKVDDGETPAEAAVRECHEETGVMCRTLEPLLTFHLGLDTIYNPTYLFYTEEFVETGMVESDEHEVHGHEWAPLSRCIEMVFAQQIIDSMSIIALLSYHSTRGGSIV